MSSFPLTLYAGGGEDYSSFYKDNGFNILYDGLLDDIRIARTSSHAPSIYNGVEYEKNDAEKTYNLLVWQRFLRKTTEEIEAIVYRGELSADLPTEVSDYLRFVQLQQPLVNPEESWNETPAERISRKQKQQAAANNAIALAKESLQTVKTPFIRQRYVFLMIRLAHYSTQHAKALKLYDHYVQDIDKLQNEVTQWIYSLRAGALQRTGKLAESAYVFAKVFARTRSLKMSSHLDFRIKTDAQWDTLMGLCKNNEEKALMHYMRALKINANSLQELQQVYQLAPNSVWVNSLLLRELEFVQFARGGDTGIQTQVLIDDAGHYGGEVKKITPQRIARRTTYLRELSQIITTMRTDKKRQDLFLVDYAALYLRLLSQKLLSVADVTAFQQKYSDTTRVQYTAALAYFVYLANLKTIDEASEHTISSYLKQIEPYVKENEWGYRDDVMAYTYSKLAPLYVKTKQQGKAYIAQHNGYIDRDKILVGELRALNALAEQANPNVLTQKMTDAFKSIVTGDEFTKGQAVEEIIARKYLAAGLFEKAQEKLQALPQETLWKTAYNPFTTSKSGNNRIKSTPKDLLAFTETMLTLQQQIATKPSDANAHFLLATAYYNMTWFGNSPMIVRNYRSTDEWDNGEIDLSKAKKHYELALQYADDKELTVKTLYALAKIEENELMMRDKQGRWPDSYDGYGEYDYRAATLLKKQHGLGKYFSKIQAYQDTEYFNEVIKQCADYKFYSAK